MSTRTLLFTMQQELLTGIRQLSLVMGQVDNQQHRDELDAKLEHYDKVLKDLHCRIMWLDSSNAPPSRGHLWNKVVPESDQTFIPHAEFRCIACAVIGKQQSDQYNLYNDLELPISVVCSGFKITPATLDKSDTRYDKLTDKLRDRLLYTQTKLRDAENVLKKIMARSHTEPVAHLELLIAYLENDINFTKNLLSR